MGRTTDGSLRFAKMHGAGNDYVFVDGRGLELDWSALSAAMSDRHLGIGSDGLIVALDSDRADLRMHMLNADGSVGRMCGNGIRCLAAFAFDSGMVPADRCPVEVETASGVLAVTPEWSDGRMVGAEVDMGEPRFGAAEVPFDEPGADVLRDHPIEAAGTHLEISCVSMGNPHAVAFVEVPVAEFDLGRVGPIVERSPIFPQGVNLEVVNVIDRERLAVRVWERGSGQTMACGTGACAAAVIARTKGLVDERVTVSLPGGELGIGWSGRGSVSMRGPVETVFAGDWPL